MTCIDWWSFEAGSFLTGTFGEVQLATYGIIFQWTALVYMRCVIVIQKDYPFYVILFYL